MGNNPDMKTDSYSISFGSRPIFPFLKFSATQISFKTVNRQARVLTIAVVVPAMGTGVEDAKVTRDSAPRIFLISMAVGKCRTIRGI